MCQRHTFAIGGAALVVVGVVVGLIAWRAWHAPTARPQPGTAQPSRASFAAPPAPTAAAAMVTAPAPDLTPPVALPGSLEGTQADGAVEADARGHLVITIELRRLFDHFLAASGEEPVATIRARIIAVLGARLPAVASAEAKDVLDRYLAYRDAARLLVPPPSSDVLAGLDQVHELRAKMLSPAVATAFFADEEAAIYAALARRDAVADQGLLPAERERRLAELDARTPAAVREARAAAMAPVNQLSREIALRAAGASDQQIAALRTIVLGAGAAARLAELDRARAAWGARLAQFRAERAAVRADRRLTDAERQRREGDLLARSFTAPERLRVEALDRIAGDSVPR